MRSLEAHGVEVLDRCAPPAHVDEAAMGKQDEVIKAAGDAGVGLVDCGDNRPPLEQRVFIPLPFLGL